MRHEDSKVNQMFTSHSHISEQTKFKYGNTQCLKINKLQF